MPKTQVVKNQYFTKKHKSTCVHFRTLSVRKPNIGPGQIGGETHFATLTDRLRTKLPRLRQNGNHDRFYGTKRIQQLLDAHGVSWVDQRLLALTINGNLVRLHGGYVPEAAAPAGCLTLVVLHEPVDVERLEGKCHVALAGHLHGCQFVFWERGFNLYPGKLFYRNNFIERRMGRLAYFISRGLGDTLPLRVNCPREVVRVGVVPFKIVDD